jgi:hypothetical protein
MEQVHIELARSLKMAKLHVPASVVFSALTLLAAVAYGQESAIDDAQASAEHSGPIELLGVWKEVSVSQPGKPDRKPFFWWQFWDMEVHLVAPPNHWYDGIPATGMVVYKYRSDPTKDPKHIDLIAGKALNECLYLIEGDTLTISLPARRQIIDAKTKMRIRRRGTEIKSTRGFPCTVITLKRVSKVEAASMPTSPDELKELFEDWDMEEAMKKAMSPWPPQKDSGPSSEDRDN